jgi:hypothetical protein
MGIRIGAEAKEVRWRLGKPLGAERIRGQTCWAYRAEQPRSALDGLAFCMSSERRIVRILLAAHG